MIKSLWEKIIKFFGGKTESNNTDYENNDKYTEEYEDIKNINFTAIFANKLAKYVVTQSKIMIDGNNSRSDLLNKVTQTLWYRMKKIVSRCFGTGGIVIAPYVKNGEICFDLISQNRMSINEVVGDKIVNATVLADIRTVNDFVTTKQYYRWTNYKIENGNCIISQKFTDKDGTIILKPNFWSNIEEEIPITNCDRVILSFLKSPVDNRKTSDLYGVPITYGCGNTIVEIHECLIQIAREFKLKQAFVGADMTLFKDNKTLTKNGLYQKFNSNKDDFWEVFDPAIRDSSYYARLQELYARLEKEIGTSEGILTKPSTQNATATEIKKSMYDTFVIVDDMRTNIAKMMDDLIYACNVLANVYKLSPNGNYEIQYDWSYDLLESTQETYNQLQVGVTKGVVKKSELRQFLFPDETIDESEKAISEIKESNPSVTDLVGGNNE